MAQRQRLLKLLNLAVKSNELLNSRIKLMPEEEPQVSKHFAWVQVSRFDFSSSFSLTLFRLVSF